MQVPETMKALVLRENKRDGLHDAVLEIRPVPRPSADQVVVKVRAVAFNRLYSVRPQTFAVDGGRQGLRVCRKTEGKSDCSICVHVSTVVLALIDGFDTSLPYNSPS